MSEKDQLSMLLDLTKLGRHVYAGTAPADKKSRKINRKK